MPRTGTWTLVRTPSVSAAESVDGVTEVGEACSLELTSPRPCRSPGEKSLSPGFRSAAVCHDVAEALLAASLEVAISRPLGSSCQEQSKLGFDPLSVELSRGAVMGAATSCPELIVPPPHEQYECRERDCLDCHDKGLRGADRPRVARSDDRASHEPGNPVDGRERAVPR
jgi:hypothetical protein